MYFKKPVIILVSILTLLGLLVGCASKTEAPPSSPAASTYKLKMATILARTHENSANFLIPYIDEVKTLTNGRIQIELYDSGSLLTGPEILQGVKLGIADFGMLVVDSYIDQLPLSSADGLPYLFDSAKQADFVFSNLMQKGILRDEFSNQDVVPVSYVLDAQRIIWLTSPVKTLAELQTKKLRGLGTEAKVLAAMGVSAVSIPAAEWMEAMRTGVVDGGSQAYVWVKGYGIQDVAKSGLSIGYHTLAFLVIGMNGTSYRALPEDIQAALNKAGIDIVNSWPDTRNKLIQVGKDLIDSKNIPVYELSAEDLAKCKDLTKTVTADWTKANGASANALMTQINMLNRLFSEQQ